MLPQPPLLGFAAYSGTGKTTLLTQLIPLLATRQLRAGLIKHSHHNFEIDHPGKDSYRLRTAGASPVMLVSSVRRAVITELRLTKEPSLFEQLQYFPSTDLDIILVEGFKQTSFPKIELHRPVLGKPLLYPKDSSIIAIASDSPLLEQPLIPTLDLNNPEQILDFTVDYIHSHAKS